MTKMKSAGTFGGGLILGVALTFCLGADKDKDAKKDWAQHLQFVSYVGGATGIYDPSVGTFYLYDANLQNLVFTRKIDNLGQSLATP